MEQATIPPPPTPEECRQRAQELRQRAAELVAQAALYEAIAAAQTARGVQDREHMSTDVSRNAAISRGRLEHKHPFPQWLADSGSSVRAWCRANGVPLVTAASWYAPTSLTRARAIPRRFAEQIRDAAGKDKQGRWRVPLDCWPSGITDHV